MEKKISKECVKTIQKLLSYDPNERPSIKELLNGKYVKKMCDKFEWNLEKLIKIKKIKLIHQSPYTDNLQILNNNSLHTNTSSTYSIQTDRTNHLFNQNSINIKDNTNDSLSQNETLNLFKKSKVNDDSSKQIFNFDNENENEELKNVKIKYFESNDNLESKSNFINVIIIIQILKILI